MREIDDLPTAWAEFANVMTKLIMDIALGRNGSHELDEAVLANAMRRVSLTPMCAGTAASADVERFPTELRRWRTTRRLSQLDLAIRAGTTQRHVSFIELGRSRPGRDVVVRLAESMDLTAREGNELLAAAGFAPAFPELPPDDAILVPVRLALNSMLGGSPNRAQPS